ncbi:rho guanine nucleotide exchange factor 15 [Megalops cyprinoides]|uniref:rho guanine nucleotide exchange factor 15 n=1 Tax=Megalops cyprinoides TaxID=118141 RepID=UPI0018640D50|nr:rho guanine nucleotide exchange factor 15 [Megalops cyprinoides]XP_036377946.1 rho guanine nucleotide exchange factor 15 [Megalops cyprinoides]
MGKEEISPAVLARPSLPPKPQVPPKPQTRAARWRRATEVILRKELDPSQVEQKARHKSLPSLPNDQSLCLSVSVVHLDDDSNLFAQTAEVQGLSARVKPLPLPKPHLQRKSLQQDNQSQIAKHTESRVSSSKPLQSPDTNDTGGRFWSGSNESEEGSAFGESQSGCAPSCPCKCHCSRSPSPREGQVGTELPLKYLPTSPLSQFLSANGPENEPHPDYWHITSYGGQGQSGRSPPKIPLPLRPLPKEPEQIYLLQGSLGKKEEPDAWEEVYMEIDVSPSEVEESCIPPVLCHGNSGPMAFPSDVGPTQRPAYLEAGHKPLPPLPAKPLPPLKTQSRHKMATHSSSEGRGRRRTCEGALQGVVAELREKFPNDSQEAKAKENCKKRETTRKLSLLNKWSPTNFMALSSSQKGKSPLADLMLLSLQNKTRTAEDSSQEAVEATELESPAREPACDVILLNELGKPPGDAADSFCIATPPDVEACQGKGRVPLMAGDIQDTGSPSQDFVRRVSSGRQHGSLKPFWQERSIVQESGVLAQLSKQQLLLQESMYEVVTTEHSYLESLVVAVDHFMESPALNLVLAPRDRKSLFSSIGKIREISQNFLEAMRVELDANLYIDVCEIIQHHAGSHFAAYVDYIRNMPYQEQTLHNLGKENPQIEEVLRKLQEHPSCHRLPLKSFLVLPFQRITRLKILVQNILKRTDPGSIGEASAERALKEVSKVVEACNREVSRMMQMEELVRIANKTEFECKALPLVSSSRWLVRQGELTQLTDKENIFGQRKHSPVYLFLFNDLLLVAVRKGLDRFVVQDHVHRSLIEISDAAEEGDVDCELEKTFLLALLKNHRGATSQRLLRASSQEEKDGWLEALSPRKSGKDEIYEEWDCPQVQCTAAYSAQQPGELSLRLGDVINIIQKTTDGFLEGRRLTDGERGWFPRNCVKEITNEHVQRRHLRQRYHVLQTATRMLRRRYMSHERHASTCFR